MVRIRKYKPSRLRSIAAGAAGGLTASFVMNQFGGLLEKVAKDRGSGEQRGDDSTVKAANAISRALFHRELNRSQKKKAGQALHYGFGALAGAFYGALARVSRPVRAGYGAAYGTAVWLAADEIAMPATRLTAGSKQYPAKVHAKSLATHAVYGLTTDLVRRALVRS